MKENRKNSSVYHSLEFAKTMDIRGRESAGNIDCEDLKEVRQYFLTLCREGAKRKIANVPDPEESANIATSAFTCMDWMKTKQSYLLTKELADDLLLSEGMDFPLHLLHLPFRTIYLDFSKAGLPDDASGYRTDGCFLTLGEVKYGKDETALLCSMVVLRISKNVLLKDPYQYGGISFDCDPEHMEKTVEERLRDMEKRLPESARVLRLAVLTAAYLSAEKPDVSENEKQKRIYRPSEKPKETSVRKWDVGIRYVEEKKAWSGSESANTGVESHASPRPHIRRAHWHTYRYGKGRTERKLLWIPPVMVGIQEDTPAVIRKVDQD